ncbi:unnamed protein product [Effrenium voratum]|nr:unnamed protein product [Effrenium voratum]
MQLLAVTAERARLKEERELLRQEAQKFRELSHQQQKTLQEKEGQLAAAAASLTKQASSLQQRDQELGAAQAQTQRQQQEIEELCEAVAWRDEEVDKIRAQLEVYEAAERRKHSYRPASHTFINRIGSVRSLEDGSESGRPGEFGKATQQIGSDGEAWFFHRLRAAFGARSASAWSFVTFCQMEEDVLSTIACLPRRAPPSGPQVPEASLNDPGIFDRPRRADVNAMGVGHILAV